MPSFVGQIRNRRVWTLGRNPSVNFEALVTGVTVTDVGLSMAATAAFAEKGIRVHTVIPSSTDEIVML